MASYSIAGLSEEALIEILDARAEGKDDPDITPEDFDLTVEKLNQVIDAIRGLELTVRAVAGNKVSSGDFKPVKRPKTKSELLLEEKLKEFDKQDVENMASDFGF